jgi:hypothetical protein
LGNRVLREHGRGAQALLQYLPVTYPLGPHHRFPFFAPAYLSGNRICIYGCHQLLEQALGTQHSARWFLVDFRSLAATIEFVTLEPGRVCEIAGVSGDPDEAISLG